MKQQHHPKDVKSFEKGINADANKEILGSKTGEHVDAKNMRSIPMDGDNFAKKKIKGEVELYPNIDNSCLAGTGLPLSDDYECMMTQNINGHIVEAWASTDTSNPPLLRVDGKIVLMTEDFPILTEFPIEYDKNDTCIGGEFYMTDNNSKPMVFNVKDLLLNSGVNVGSETGECTTKYFTAFDLSKYVVGISSSLFKMVFITQHSSTGGNYEAVFGSNGMVVGMNSYSYRYVTSEGDRSGWSVQTELIPTVRGISNLSYYMPKTGNYGGEPNVTNPTTYGNKLRLKYDNTSGFDFIEVRRDAWYGGAPQSSPPDSSILGSFDINEGLNIVDIFDYASPTEAQEPLSIEQIVDVPEDVQKAKAVRYFNQKLWLMNVEYKSKDVNDEIVFLDDGPRIIPTIENMGHKGHVDPYKAAYFKSNMRGEAYGFGVTLYDSSGARTHAVEAVDSYQFPNRRDIASAETIGNSYKGTVKAATTGSFTQGPTPQQTHEVFDHVNADTRDIHGDEVAPDDNPQNIIPSLVNILDDNIGGTSTHPYKTLHPVSQTDTQENYKTRINTHVYNTNDMGANAIDYNPKAFRLDYYSMGAAFRGIDDSLLPDWVEGFSVVQTNPAKRVIAQGLGFYDLSPVKDGFDVNGAKGTHSIICSFPDLDQDTGLNPQELENLIGTHGSASPYRLEMVSPLGFFSEFYSYFSNSASAKRKALDGITYCRILHDEGLINPGWDGDPSLDNYVGFGSWRFGSTNPTMFGGNYNVLPNGDPNLFIIDTIAEAQTENGSKVNFRITTTASQRIYNETSQGNTQDFNNNALKKWQEPVYAVNIVKNDAKVNAGITTDYNYTGHYIKLKSKILTSDGSASQSTVLVSERWEDCIRVIVGQLNNAYMNLNRFTYVVDALGNETRWMNVQGYSTGQIANINTDITNNGFYIATDASGSYNVYGTYTSVETFDGTASIFTLTYDNLPSGVSAYVKYDKRIPIRVFGGDTYVNEHIFPVIDNTTDKNGNPQGGSGSAHEFKFNVPFPYPMYALNARIGLVGNCNTTITNRYLTWTDMPNIPTLSPWALRPGQIYFDTSLWGLSLGVENWRPTEWRQLVTMWAAETRINLSFAYNLELNKSNEDSQFFPLKNYIYRPSAWGHEGDVDSIPPDSPNFLEKNNIDDEYYYDYGIEWNNWGHGGFRSLPATNLDYNAKQNTEIITTVPLVGFTEEVRFCTRVLYSVTRPINVQDTPSVKTFPPTNFYDMSDDTGEIKFAWDGDSDKGNNLYALTAQGVCLLLVDKRIVSEINADELATVGSDIGGVTGELWLDKEKGMDNETWRSWAEYSNVLFWTNSTSSYALSGNSIKDIADSGYSSLLRREFIPKANKGVGGKMSGVYDILHKEYYVNTYNNDEYSTLIYGVSQGALQCQSDYNYDKYLAINNEVYGMKGLSTYKLGEGNLLNGVDYECYLSGVSDKDMYYDKEFLRIRVNSNSKPKRIEFFDDYDNYLADTPSSIVDAVANPISIKDYFGYECYIPRKDLAPHNRQQGRVLIFKIVSETDENYFVSTAGIQYKALK